jgi:hypothetical protein
VTGGVVLVYLSVASAWLIWVLVAAAIVIPYLVRPTRIARSLGLIGAWSGAKLARMRPHMWLGCAIAGVIVAHALLALRAGGFSQVGRAGIWFAMIALALAFGQLVIGIALAQEICAQRSLLRRAHFAAMIGLVVTALGHTLLNAPGP